MPSAVRFTPARAALVLGGLLVLAVASLAISVLLGEYPVHLGRALSEPASADGQVLFGLRIPGRCSGRWWAPRSRRAAARCRRCLRNPLADPFVLGVSGGAALGATVALALGLQALAGPSLFAFVGRGGGDGAGARRQAGPGARPMRRC